MSYKTVILIILTAFSIAGTAVLSVRALTATAPNDEIHRQVPTLNIDLVNQIHADMKVIRSGVEAIIARRQAALTEGEAGGPSHDGNKE